MGFGSMACNKKKNLLSFYFIALLLQKISNSIRYNIVRRLSQRKYTCHLWSKIEYAREARTKYEGWRAPKGCLKGAVRLSFLKEGARLIFCNLRGGVLDGWMWIVFPEQFLYFLLLFTWLNFIFYSVIFYLNFKLVEMALTSFHYKIEFTVKLVLTNLV